MTADIIARPRAFRFEHFTGIDGSMLFSNDESRVATEQDMEWFWRAAGPDLDRLTLEMCAAERQEGNDVPDWLLKVELDAFHRIRGRGRPQ